MKTIAQIRAEIQGERENMRRREEAGKSNPHLEAIANVVLDMEECKVDMKGAVQRLKAITSEMVESPLVLKVDPEHLKAVNTESYRHSLAMASDRLRLEAENFQDKAQDVIRLISHLLHTLTSKDKAGELEAMEETMLADLSSTLWWVLEWGEEYKAKRSLGPEGAALACLAGEGFAEFYGVEE